MRLKWFDYIMALVYFALIFTWLSVSPESFTMGYFLLLSILYMACFLSIKFIQNRQHYS